MGESNISQQPATLPQNVPPNLPDLRTAQRLLDVLSQLEFTLRNGAPQTKASATANSALQATLQAENTQLKVAQTQALQRLETLIGKLRQQAEGQPEEQAA
jgi:hypothetical protein